MMTKHPLDKLDYFGWPCDKGYDWSYVIADPTDIDQGIENIENITDWQQTFFDQAYWYVFGSHLNNDVIIECTGNNSNALSLKKHLSIF